MDLPSMSDQWWIPLAPNRHQVTAWLGLTISTSPSWKSTWPRRHPAANLFDEVRYLLLRLVLIAGRFVPPDWLTPSSVSDILPDVDNDQFLLANPFPHALYGSDRPKCPCVKSTHPGVKSASTQVPKARPISILIDAKVGEHPSKFYHFQLIDAYNRLKAKGIRWVNHSSISLSWNPELSRSIAIRVGTPSRCRYLVSFWESIKNLKYQMTTPFWDQHVVVT